MKKETKEKFEIMVCEALTTYYENIYNYIYEIIKITNYTGDNNENNNN